MSIRRLPSGSYQARIMIDGVTHSETLPSEQAARDWLLMTQARALSGPLPKRTTVAEYAARWLATYDTGPSSTRAFHRGNLSRHIVPGLGRRHLGEVTPTEISQLLNGVSAAVSVATADAVYRTCSALFNAAAADDLIVRSPVRSKRHRPRRQAEPRVALERKHVRALLPHLVGWHRDTALLQLALGARIGEIAGLTPPMSTGHALSRR